MTKAGIISSYINKCNQILESKDEKLAQELVNEIIAVYNSEIKEITMGLDSNYIGMYNERKIDYIGDIKILKAKLENYKSDLKRGPIDKYKNTTFTINNSASANVSNQINVTLEQTLKNINELSSNILSEEDKQELEDKLASLELAVKLRDKEKIGTKLLNVLKFAITKGPETFIAISNFINFITNDIAPLFKSI